MAERPKTNISVAILCLDYCFLCQLSPPFFYSTYLMVEHVLGVSVMKPYECSCLKEHSSRSQTTTTTSAIPSTSKNNYNNRKSNYNNIIKINNINSSSINIINIINIINNNNTSNNIDNNNNSNILETIFVTPVTRLIDRQELEMAINKKLRLSSGHYGKFWLAPRLWIRRSVAENLPGQPLREPGI